MSCSGHSGQIIRYKKDDLVGGDVSVGYLSHFDLKFLESYQSSTPILTYRFLLHFLLIIQYFGLILLKMLLDRVGVL